MSGLSATGFQIERLPEIKAGIEQSLVQAFGNVDLRAESIFGQLVGISSEVDAILWQVAEDVYQSQYPDSASGVSLDYVCALNGVTRIPAFPTQVQATVTGVPGTLLSSGREATNAQTGDVYRLPVSVRIDGEACVGARIKIKSTTPAGDYTVNIQNTLRTYTSPGGETAQEVLTGVQSAIILSGFVQSTFLGDGFLDVFLSSPALLEVSARLNVETYSVPATFQAINTGPLALSAGDLSEIKTPVAGWQAITNDGPGVIGANEETDAQLRARRQRSIQITATNTLDAIFSRLRQVPLVTDVNVLQNNGIVTDEFGTPRQHVWAVVEGGDDADIADVLFNAVAAGIGYRGATTVEVVSEISGKTYQVGFDRPTYVDPLVVVTYTRLAGFPAEGEELIRAALVARTFQIGERLTQSRLYTPINTVPGVEIDGLTIDGVADNLIAAPNEKIRLLSDNISFVDAT